MTTFRVVGLTACAFALLVAGACGEDEAVVRPRLGDGGTSDAAGANDAGDGTLSCGVVRPTVYESQNFVANAAAELALTKAFYNLDAKMAQATDLADAGDAGAPATAAELKALYAAETPSLLSASTGATQTAVNAYFDMFEQAGAKSWAPSDAEQDAGLAGGLYGSATVSPTGVDLREAVTKALLQGALYNHALGIVVTNQASVDQLLASFGATTAFANRTDADAGEVRDRLIAEYASNRDDKTSALEGPYRKIRDALLTMKAAVAAGDKCNADRDAAVSVFRTQWEKAVFASAIFYLNAAADIIVADPSKGPEAIHAFGSALGFIESFQGVSADKRKITDVQIAAIREKIGATTPWKLVTSSGDRSAKLRDAIKDIASYQGFTDGEVESFKKSF